MKNRASLALMELLLMVLVFALAAAACLGCFVWSAQTSQDILLRDEAVILAQNAAEALKLCGDPEKAESMLNGAPEGLTLHIEETEAPVPGLGQAEITVKNDAGETLFSLTAAWQEEA